LGFAEHRGLHFRGHVFGLEPLSDDSIANVIAAVQRIGLILDLPEAQDESWE
jgi:hypothetical protein